MSAWWDDIQENERKSLKLEQREHGARWGLWEQKGAGSFLAMFFMLVSIGSYEPTVYTQTWLLFTENFNLQLSPWL